MHIPKRAYLAFVFAWLAASSLVAEDAAAIKALFRQYSPDAFAVVDSYSKRTTENGGPDFMRSWNPSSDDAPWASFFLSVDESLSTLLEYKYYALKYILFLERDSPQSWRMLMANLNGGVAVEDSPGFLGMTLVAAGATPRIKALLSDADALALGGLNVGYLAGKPTSAALHTWQGEAEAGDVGNGAVDITGADCRLFPDKLVCGVSFAAADAELIFNGPKVDADSMEYECSIVIDVNGNGKTVYTLSLDWFKQAKAAPLSASLSPWIVTR